jgi:hypothetical protein
MINGGGLFVSLFSLYIIGLLAKDSGVVGGNGLFNLFLDRVAKLQRYSHYLQSCVTSVHMLMEKRNENHA